MKHAFELLKSRPNTDKLVNLEELEQTYNIKIPPIYKSFLNMFYMEENDICIDRVYVEDKNYKFDFSHIFSTYDPDDIIIVGLITIEKSLKRRKDIYSPDSAVIQNGYIPFIDTVLDIVIHIGTQGEETDMVIFDYDGGDCRNMGINVFEFVQSLVLYEVKDEDMPFGIKKSDIYKNWGEDFWRVR